MRAQWFIMLPALLMIGCATGPRARMSSEAESTPDMNSRRYALLMRLGAKEIDCSKQELVYSHQGENRHGLAGCGRSTEFLLICLGTQCRWTQPPIAQASFDLDCPVENLELVPIRKHKIGVKGCGRRGSYGWICQSVLNCDWYKDGVGGSSSKAAIAAAKAKELRVTDTGNRNRRLSMMEESRRMQSFQRATMQDGIAGAAAAAGAARNR